jgi:hypothetical protein
MKIPFSFDFTAKSDLKEYFLSTIKNISVSDISIIILWRLEMWLMSQTDISLQLEVTCWESSSSIYWIEIFPSSSRRSCNYTLYKKMNRESKNSGFQCNIFVQYHLTDRETVQTEELGLGRKRSLPILGNNLDIFREWSRRTSIATFYRVSRRDNNRLLAELENILHHQYLYFYQDCSQMLREYSCCRHFPIELLLKGHAVGSTAPLSGTSKSIYQWWSYVAEISSDVINFDIG